MRVRVLVIDCYDSFTYNLCQQVGKLGAVPVVVTSDTPFDAIRKIDCDRIILSPGPGRPEHSGVCLEVLHTLSKTIPTLGVCLGHQAICVAFGGEVRRAAHLMHGKTSQVLHDGTGIFSGLERPLIATRYHSLVADPEAMPDDLLVSATSSDDGYVMAVRHRAFPIDGVQFHPESILCEAGDRLICNFLYDSGRRGG